MILGSLSYDTGSGLAGVLFEKVESKPRNSDHVPVLQLLANAEGLHFCPSIPIRYFYDLEYCVFHSICDNQITHLGVVLFTVCHADSFPQIVKMTNPVEIQTAPLPFLASA